jgi:protoporphyrinogen oxidase
MLDPRPVGTAGTVVVLGAGVAGLFAADRLSAAGHRVAVIERSSRCGGNHRSRQIGDYTFDVGSIFYEDGARIFDLALGLREQCPLVTRVQRRISPEGTILHYPLEPREVLRPAHWGLSLALLDLAASRVGVRRDGTLYAISRKRLGGTFLATTGLEAYMTRFHHVSPRQIDEEFFFHRMAFIERSTRFGALLHAALRSLNRPGAAKTVRPPLRVRPRSGFEALFGPIAERLMSRGVQFHFLEDLQSIARLAGTYHVRTSKALHIADAVVSTIPLDTVYRASFGEGSGLVSLDMTTLFVSAEWLDPRAGNVLFNFHRRGDWKRATIYSRIYPKAADGREFLSVEATIAPGARHDPRSSFADFRAHVEELGLARGLKLEGHERVADCYPLYSPGSSARLQSVLERVSATGVVLAGRQGRFEYLPTSSKVIRRVAEELDRAAIPAPAELVA